MTVTYQLIHCTPSTGLACSCKECQGMYCSSSSCHAQDRAGQLGMRQEQREEADLGHNGLSTGNTLLQNITVE